MRLILPVIGAFFANYIIYWFLGFFHLKDREKTSFIVITVANLVEIGFYIYALVEEIISGEFSTELGMAFALQILALIFGYILISSYLFNGIKIFGGHRRRKFERAYKNTTKCHFIIMVSLFTILSLIIIGLGIAICIISYKWYYLLIVIFGIILLAITCFIFFTNNINNATSKKKKTLFLVKTDFKTYLYQNKLNESIDFELKELKEIFVIEELGKISGDLDYQVFGVFTHNIKDEYLSLIHMDSVLDQNIIKLTDNFVKGKKLKIDVKNNQIESIKEYK